MALLVTDDDDAIVATTTQVHFFCPSSPGIEIDGFGAGRLRPAYAADSLRRVARLALDVDEDFRERLAFARHEPPGDPLTPARINPV